MPATFWGHLDPEREELRNALLRAQTRQMETQTSLAEMLGAQQQQQMQQQGMEDDEFQWEELEFKKEQLKQETELNKAQQLLLGRQMTLKEEEAQRPVQMGLGEMLLSPEGEPMVTPGTQIGGALVDPLTGEPMYEAPITAGLEQTVIRPDTGEVLKVGMVKTPKGSIVTTTGEEIYTEPEVVVEGAEVIILDPGTGDIINRIDVAQVPRGFDIKVDQQGNVYSASLDTGEVELVQESQYYEQEYKYRERALKVQQFGIEVESKGYDVELHGMNLEAHITQKGYDRDIDVQLIKQDIQDSVNLTAIEKQQLMNRADELAGEVTDRRTEAMLVGYDVDKYGHDIRRYAADVGYDETIDGNMIIRDIQASKSASDIQKQELIALTTELSDQSAERRNTATIEAGDRKLVADRYLKGYVFETAEEALAYTEAKARIEAKYDPYTTPNMMNRVDAEAWLSYKAGIDLFVEKGKTDEKIRFEFGKARASQTSEDLLKGTAARMMEMTEGAELGRQLLELPLEELELERDVLGLRREEAELKREGTAQGVAGDEQELLRDMMLRATATHKPTYGVYGQKEKVMAANTLLELIRLDRTLRPETKMQYLEAVPSLTGVTLAEELQKGKVPYFDWFRGMFNQALDETEVETGVTRPSEKFKGTSLEDIIREVEEVWGRTGSRKEIAKYLKKYNLTLDKYREVSQKWLAR